MSQPIREARNLLRKWQREKNAFMKRHEHYEPNGDGSHIWSNLTQVFENIDDDLEDYGDA